MAIASQLGLGLESSSLSDSIGWFDVALKAERHGNLELARELMDKALECERQEIIQEREDAREWLEMKC